MLEFVALIIILILFGLWEYTTRWVPVSDDEVIWAWLKVESQNPNHQYQKYYQAQIDEFGTPVLDNPNFRDAGENELRRNIFNKVRGDYILWKPIYENTKWYRVRLPLWKYRICGPYPPNAKELCIEKESNLHHIVLWGHSKEDILIVLEGNHRWYNRKNGILIPEVYVGLSDRKYELHSLTKCEMCSKN